MKPMDGSTESFGKAVRLHGKAWLAVMAWCEFVLGSAWTEKHDDEWRAREFFPTRVTSAARRRMNEMYRKGSKSRRAKRAR